MKKLVSFFLFAFLATQIIFAQELQVKCGNEDIGVAETPLNNTELACFDVDLVMQGCIPVYVRMNFHFFTDDACTGNVQILNGAQSSAYKEAEKLLNEANQVLANNVQQFHVNPTEVPCNPIRYVLSGVYIHCKTNALGGFSTPNLHANYGVNTTSEVNVYVASSVTKETGVGYPTFVGMSWMDTGNLNHEIGHTFSLAHSFEEDGCDDTEKVTHEWDKDCDGVIEGNETGLQCWTIIEPNTPVDCSLYNQGMASPGDNNINGVQDCKEDLGINVCNPNIPPSPSCENRPCCDWANINNNIMSYSGYKEAFSACQIRKMLTDLANTDCGFIQSIGGYPPPSAFISQTPSDIKNTNFCSECIILEASFNDFKHSYRIIEVATGLEVVNTGWVMGGAKNYCFSTADIFVGGVIPQGGKYLKPNKMYRIELTVANEGGVSDFADYTFTTPGTDCSHPNPGNGGSMRVNPNPATDQVLLEFNADAMEKVHIYSVHTITSQASLLASELDCIEGVNQVQLSLSQLNAGNYRLMLVSSSRFEYINFSKF
jgi:hypothetical protein